MPKIPRTIAEAIAASLQQVMPDGMRLAVTPGGRWLEYDTDDGGGAGSAFATTLLFVSKRLGLRLVAIKAMDTAADFASRFTHHSWPRPADTEHDHTGDPWCDKCNQPHPPRDVDSKVKVTHGQLHMAYAVRHGQNFLQCPPVTLPPGWH